MHSLETAANTGMTEQKLKRASEMEPPMIPINVKSYLSKDVGDILRGKRQSALKVLHQLGVEPATEFGDFYLQFQGGFISPKPLAELLDIEGPAIPAIPDQTEYARDRFQLPEKFLALTSDESEGMYLYNKHDQGVYDFDLTKVADFLSNRVSPRWFSFNEFLTWYFEECVVT